MREERDQFFGKGAGKVFLGYCPVCVLCFVFFVLFLCIYVSAQPRPSACHGWRVCVRVHWERRRRHEEGRHGDEVRKGEEEERRDGEWE